MEDGRTGAVSGRQEGREGRKGSDPLGRFKTAELDLDHSIVPANWFPRWMSLTLLACFDRCVG